ncbi:MAG: glycosyltransferase family 2 protein [Clostridia bacterium]
MSQNTLSVCMIAKNEEKNIERCLKSISHIADEIIVVDTGSTDSTVEIAKKYNAKVILHQWKNDFSDARNKSLEYATKEWILFLDADEELTYDDSLTLKNILSQSNKFEGLFLRLVNLINNTDIGDAIVFRVFRNNPEYRFKGKMHEQVINSIQEKKGSKSIASTEIKILHYGYDPSLSDINKKAHRNLDLLLSYDEKDKDGYYYYALGNEYTRLDNVEKALENFNTALNKTNLKDDLPIYYTYLMTSIIKLLISKKRFQEVINYIKVFKKSCRDFKDLYFFESMTNIELSKISDAKKALTMYLNCKQTVSSYPNNKFENQYDINLLMEQLKNGSISHDEKLLSAVILAKDNEESLVTTIKSLNEIAYEVLVVTPETSNLDRSKIKNYGARVFDVSFKNDNEYYAFAFKKCRGKFVFIIEPKDICPFISQQPIVDLLTTSPRDGYYFLLTDSSNNILGKSLRLLKKNKKLNNFENFSKLASESNFKDSTICLSKLT